MGEIGMGNPFSDILIFGCYKPHSLHNIAFCLPSLVRLKN